MRRAFVALLALAACSRFDAGTRVGAIADAGADDAAPTDGGTPAPVCSAEVDLRTDGRNCGACKHDCLGGGCMNAQCLPIDLGNIGGTDGIRLSMDDTTLYVGSTSNAAFYRVSKQGGPVENVSLKAGGTVGQVLSLTNRLLVASKLGLLSVNRDSVSDQTSINQIRADAVVADDDVIVACDYVDPSVLDGNGHLQIISRGTSQILGVPSVGEGCESLAIEGDRIYFANEDAISYVTKSNVGANPTIEANHGARRFVMDSGSIWSLYYKDDFVARTKRDGLEVTTSAADNPNGALNQTGEIAMDDQYVYWQVASSMPELSDGAIYRIEKTAPEHAVPDPLVTSAANPKGIVVDGAAIYWLEAGSGTIRKLAK